MKKIWVKNSRNRKAEDGQSLLELSISLIVLLLLLGGAIDLGRLFFAYLALRDAAQEGASYASFMPKDTAGIIARVRTTSSTPLDLTDPNVLITVTPPATGTFCAGERIGVTVEYQKFQFIMPLISTFTGRDGFPLRASITDTILNPICD